MSEDKFDAIVVGAGPAGSACAYTLAKEGRSVLLLERGDTPGAKNVSGGRLYTYALELVDPGLYERAPLQRKIIREQVMLLNAGGATTVDYFDPSFGAEVPQSYSVIRADLDEWFAGEAEAQGAMLAPGVLVDDLIEEGGQIVGIRTGEDEMRADVVVAADGVNSLLGQKAGLFPDAKPHAVGVGVKETIELPDSLISARFGVQDGEGAARVAIGCTDGISGGGFLYTNKGSISLGIVFNPVQAGRQERHIQDIFQDFKMHPAILSLIDGGTSIEYGAHLVPELGFHGIPKRLSRPGLVVVGDAAQFGINTGVIIRGMDMAIVSGLAAARALIAAKQPADVERLYQQQLEELLLIANQKAYQNFHGIFEIPRIFHEYPNLANDAMRFMFRVDGKTPKPMFKGILETIKRNVSFGRLAADCWKIYRHL
ncbi:FAD-dependent oxidoreductase [Brenneria goodwinii]|uniref:FAD-dependent oxidoreductase n=1 Tax=Brenneria goodwinii TaxID=1109412 RepID=UPI0036E0BEE6